MAHELEPAVREGSPILWAGREGRSSKSLQKARGLRRGIPLAQKPNTGADLSQTGLLRCWTKKQHPWPPPRPGGPGMASSGRPSRSVRE